MRESETRKVCSVPGRVRVDRHCAEDDDWELRVEAVFLLQENVIYEGISEEGRDDGRESSGGMRVREDEKGNTRIVSGFEDLWI